MKQGTDYEYEHIIRVLDLWFLQHAHIIIPGTHNLALNIPSLVDGFEYNALTGSGGRCLNRVLCIILCTHLKLHGGCVGEGKGEVYVLHP